MKAERVVAAAVGEVHPKQVGECQCDTCQSACKGKPGWFAPDEIEPLAQAMGITTQKLFDDHLQIDWYSNFKDADEEVFVLSPRIVHELGGTMFPGNPRGACHWFKDGRCQIHLLGKPSECAQATHDMSHDESMKVKDAITAEWVDKLPMIRELYGDDPEADHDFSIFDVLSMYGY